MITPSFNLTATERVLPKLALDFTTAALDSRITFTRTTDATHPATYVNSSGVITTATNNQPRFDYDPMTLACRGLLIEESRINVAKYSEEFDNSAWTKTRSTITADAVVSPSGTTTADKFVEDTTASSTHELTQNYINATGSFTWSIYAKAGERNWLVINAYAGASYRTFFNLSTGEIGTNAAGNTASIIYAGNGWYRCTVTRTLGSSLFVANILQLASADNVVSYTGNGTSGIYIWGAQLEAGTFATSYIPTTTTALTRNADIATMTGTSFSNWYNAGTGAFNCAVLPKSATGTKPVLQFDDATVLNTITMQGNATVLEFKITTLNVLQSTLSTGTIAANVAYGSCGAWTMGSNALSKSGGAAATGSPVSIPTVTQSRLGSDGTNYLNGWLQKINYWPQRITNAEVQAFSK